MPMGEYERTRGEGDVMAVGKAKIDLWAENKELFTPSAKQPLLVKVPAFAYIMVDGSGDPNTSAAFRDAIGALYGAAYTLKFMLKKSRGIDFRVMPLSGRFHSARPSDLLLGRKSEWKWTLMIPLPSVVRQAEFAKAVTEAGARKNASPALRLLRREVFKEGLCAQILHVGPYAAEKPTIEKLHTFIQEQGLTFAGSHHEIYVSDPNRSAPEKLKTIVRQPVKKE
jgi:hypothetical protein